MYYSHFLYSFFSVPPEYPAIFDRYGRQLNGSLGPYKEGDNISLTCRVAGGMDWFEGLFISSNLCLTQYLHFTVPCSLP